MKTLVIYNSNTGFTERYARGLSQRLSCPCIPLKRLDQSALCGYDRIIFGGWVMANTIMGLDKLRGMTTPAAVFAVGCTPAFEEVVKDIRERNQLADTPFFYLQGGLRFDRLGLAQRVLLKAVKKAVMKKSNRTRQDDFMAEVLGTSSFHFDPAQLAPLAEFAGAWK